MEHKKAVIDGVLQHVSASQIRRFRECPLKWYREKVLGQEFRPTLSMALGTKIHKYIEEGGVELNDVIRTSVALAKGFVPAGGEHEAPIEIDIAGIPCVGFIDYYVPGTVVDWKSTSDFSRNKAPSELARDEQAIIYSAWALDQYDDLRPIRFMYVYVHTKEPGATPVVVDITKSMVQDAWEALTKTVESMKIAAGWNETGVLCKCGKCKGAVMAKTEVKTKLEITLYVDCIPLNGDYTSLSDYVQEMNARAAGDKRDTRLVDFGKGKGGLAEMVRNNPPAAGSYVLMTQGSDLASTVAEALIPMVKFPIRGI